MCIRDRLYPALIANETRVESIGVEDADIVLAAYGTASRMCRAAMETLKGELKLGLIRPKTLWPFPYEAFETVNPKCKAIICPEINIMGQMIDDVRIACLLYTSMQSSQPLQASRRNVTRNAIVPFLPEKVGLYRSSQSGRIRRVMGKSSPARSAFRSAGNSRSSAAVQITGSPVSFPTSRTRASPRKMCIRDR